MTEENNKQWKIYIVADMRTWSAPKVGEKQTPIEYYNDFSEAKQRFNSLRNEPYNYENAPSWDGTPSARLTLGIEKENATMDILHVCGGENVLVDDFTRSKDISENPAAMSLITQTAAEIGFDKMNSYSLLANGRYGEPEIIPFDKWAAENPQFYLTGGTKMEFNTKFEVSSISKIDSGNVKALANIVINGELAVRGIKVMEGEKGLFVAMPSKKIGGEYVDIAHPITDKAHEQISGAVLESYNRLVRSGEKTLRADVPAAEQSASDVKVSLKSVKNNAHLKAAGQITIDGCFAVRDVKVLETAGKPPFVSMPSYKTKSGDYAQFSLPITKDFREKLDKAVLGSYQAVGKAEHKAEKNNSQKFVGSKTQNTKHKR